MPLMHRSHTRPLAYAVARDRGPLDVGSRQSQSPVRRRGRPPLVSPEAVLEQIRRASVAGELIRVHLDQPALYARARRLWGSWARALDAAGIDYGNTIAQARRRATESRRRPGEKGSSHA